MTASALLAKKLKNENLRLFVPLDYLNKSEQLNDFTDSLSLINW